MSGIIEIIDGVDRSKIFGRVLWNDINFPAAALTLGAVAPDSINILSTGNIKAPGFNGNNTVEMVYGSADILHGYLEGSDIEFHIHWMPVSANTGNVNWQLEYSWAKVDDAFPNPTTIAAADAAGGTPWVHRRAEFAPIDGTGKTINSSLVFRLFRDPADVADTYGFDAALVQIGIHYQVDVYGSRSEIMK